MSPAVDYAIALDRSNYGIKTMAGKEDIVIQYYNLNFQNKKVRI